MNIEELLRMVVEKKASDLHLRVPSPPVLRIDGILRPQEQLPAVTPQFVKESLERITNERQRERFYNEMELDMPFSIAGLARCRVNAFFQRGTISLAIRQVPLKIPTVDEMGLPAVCKTLALKTKGLVLVTGPTGMGKSTTLAAMIETILTLITILLISPLNCCGPCWNWRRNMIARSVFRLPAESTGN